MKTNLSKLAFAIFLALFCVLASNAQEGNNTNKSANKTQKNDKEQDKSKDCPKSGVARIKVTFDKSGEVTKAEIVSSAGCNFFDEQALKAAKTIQLKPSKKNDKKSITVKLVEYTFTSMD